MKAPIRLRMTAWYVVLLAAIIAAMAAFVILQLRADLLGAVDRGLRPAIAQIATGYQVEGVSEFRDKSASVLTGEHPAAQILTLTGRVVALSGYRVGARPMLDSATRATVLRVGTSLVTRSLGPGPAYRVIAVAVRRAGARQIVAAAVSLGSVDRSVSRLLTLFGLAVPAALAATAAGGWWLARRALRPVDRMVDTAEAIRSSDSGSRVAVPATSDELAHLARALNRMLDRVDSSVAQQRRLVADTSHELRTPLAVMRTDIDVALRSDRLTPTAREILESNRDEVDSMIATVEDLLTLARADDRRLAPAREHVELLSLTHSVMERLRSLASGRGVRVVCEGSQTAVWGDRQQLGHALRNLLENAIKFGPANGTVVVRTWRDAHEGGVTIEDEGPGIPPELRERVFERYFRAETSRDRATGGSGLGLAIVQELIHAQGGRVAIASRQPRGTSFSVSLPLAPEPHGGREEIMSRGAVPSG